MNGLTNEHTEAHVEDGSSQPDIDNAIEEHVEEAHVEEDFTQTGGDGFRLDVVWQVLKT